MRAAPRWPPTPGSLAGKVLRIEQPTTVDQAPLTTAMSGMGAGGGMCIDPSDGSLYITDRTPTADRLQRITKDSKTSTVWTWPDKPGRAGCAALDGTVSGQPGQHQADRGRAARAGAPAR